MAIRYRYLTPEQDAWFEAQRARLTLFGVDWRKPRGLSSTH